MSAESKYFQGTCFSTLNFTAKVDNDHAGAPIHLSTTDDGYRWHTLTLKNADEVSTTIKALQAYLKGMGAKKP